MPDTLTVDLHPVFRNNRDIDLVIRQAIFRALREQIPVVEFIPGRGSGALKRKVLAVLGQPHLRKLFRWVEQDPDNTGRVLVHF